MRIEEEHQDVLQNMEFAVANLYRQHPEMTDYTVMAAYEALIQRYGAELKGHAAKPTSLSEREAELFQAVGEMCEWRLGRAVCPGSHDQRSPCEPIDVATIVLCLKRLVKSVQKWNKQGGRQGYLDFMSAYVP